MSLLDAIYMTRARAIEEGATHDGIHFGIPHWVWMDGGEFMACPKLRLLEPWMTFCLMVHAFVNGMRDPDEQVDFAFAVRPINKEGSA